MLSRQLAHARLGPTQLVTQPARHLLFGRRLLNKNLKRQSDFHNSFDPNSYLVAIKKFQRETQGVRKGTIEFENIRNKIYEQLRNEKATQLEQEAQEAGNFVKAIRKENIAS